MARRVPIVREIRWIWVIPQLVLLALLILLARSLVQPPLDFLLGAALYLSYSFVARYMFARHHRRGMGLIRARQWEAATSHFRQSYDFFAARPWLDRYRWLLLLSSSAASYREMALLNEAFSLVQQGHRVEARAVYQRTLDEFPDSSMAESALNLMEPVA
jgi:hypothetical protein